MNKSLHQNFDNASSYIYDYAMTLWNNLERIFETPFTWVFSRAKKLLWWLSNEVENNTPTNEVVYNSQENKEIYDAIQEKSLWWTLLGIVTWPLKRKIWDSLRINDNIEEFYQYKELLSDLKAKDYASVKSDWKDKLQKARTSWESGEIIRIARWLTKIEHHQNPEANQKDSFVWQLTPWDVVLINKSNQSLSDDWKIADWLLEVASTKKWKWYAMTHVMIVVSRNPFLLSHSTWKKETQNGKWSEIVDGNRYLNTYPGTYTSLRPKYRWEIKNWIHAAAKEITENEWSDYSYFSAFFDFFGSI